MKLRAAGIILRSFTRLEHFNFVNKVTKFEEWNGQETCYGSVNTQQQGSLYKNITKVYENPN